MHPHAVARLALICSLPLLLSACAHGVTVTKPSQVYAPPREAQDNRAPIAYLEPLTVRRVDAGGTQANPSEGFKENLVAALGDSNVFQHVVTSFPIGQKNVVTLKPSADENLDLNAGANGTKAFFVGLTLFLLTPALPLTYEYSNTVTIDAQCPNGETRRYSQVGQASSWAMGISQVQPAVTEMVGTTNERVRNALVCDLARDKMFFQKCASGAE